MFRTIIKAKKRKLILTVPENYEGKNLEVFVFPASIGNGQDQLEKCFDSISLNTQGFKFDREEANER